MIGLQDFTRAIASLRNARGYTATVAVTLGITLGALVTAFGLNYQFLAAPLPYPDGERLYFAVGNEYRNDSPANENSIPYPALVTAFENSGAFFEERALYDASMKNVRNLPDSPSVVTGYVTPGYLQMLQAPMALGRNFSADEGLGSFRPVSVISYASWEKWFDRDPQVLEKTLQVKDVNFRIVGVTARGFREPRSREYVTQVWLPWDYNGTSESRRNNWESMDGGKLLAGKLKPGLQPALVEQQLSALVNSRFQQETAARPSGDQVSIGLKLLSFREAFIGSNNLGRLLLILAGMATLVLIASTNIASLILARAASQYKDMAIEAALGAQKSHLFSRIFAETSLLMLLSTAVAVSLWGLGIKLIKGVAASQFTRVAELTINWQGLAFILLVSLALALLFTFLVSRQIDYRALNGLLQNSGKGAGIQISGKVRRALVLVQVTLTGILLTASMQILHQSLRHILQPLGFQTGNIDYARLDTWTEPRESAQEQYTNLVAIREALLAHPKVRNVSLSSHLPIDIYPWMDNQWYSPLAVDPDGTRTEMVATALVDERHLDILGLELLGGRNFSSEESRVGEGLLIINQTLYKKLRSHKRGGEILNRNFFRNINGEEKPFRVIGVVRDISLPGREEVSRMYLPQMRWANARAPMVLLQYKPGQRLDRRELNRVIATVNSQYRVWEKFSLTESHRALVARDKLAAGFTAALSLLALGLAAIGLYGILSYSVLIRRFELGIRMAVGSRPLGVFLQVLKDNLAPVLIGLALALAAVAGLWLWIQQSRYSVQTSAPGWLLPSVLILALTSAVTLLSVWRVINRPAIDALQGHQ